MKNVQIANAWGKKNLFRRLILGIFIASNITIFSQANADYATHPAAAAFVEKMVKEHKFEKPYIENILKGAEKKQSIIDAMMRPAEKTKAWKDYRRIFLGQDRVDQGVAFWRENKKNLNRAYAEFGVPPEMVVAIIGVETRYGRHKGRYRVIDALTTLGFDYAPRAKFFSKELEHFFLLAKEQKQDPFKLMGSYAGAMGYGQFIPSSYRSYAKDFDGDDFVDIWNNPVDAIGSVANYFKRHRWQKNAPVVGRARVASNYDKALTNPSGKPKLTLDELAKKGFSPLDKNLDRSTKALPLEYEGVNGKEFWLGYNNFYVITRYNRSRLYAMAVWQLSQEIRKASAGLAAAGPE